VSDRDVDQILVDLRRRLEATALAKPTTRRGLRGVRRVALVLALASSAVVSTAVATRSVWAPSAPGDAGRGSQPVQVAVGGPASARWSLAGQRCSNGGVATFLRVGGGGAGRGCGARPAPISSYYDPRGQTTYVFALVPASAKTARLGLRGTPAGSSVPRVIQVTTAPGPADALAVSRGRLPPSAVLVASHSGAWTVATVAVLDRAGQVDLRCQETQCTGD
jgi:hypothetical protein